MAYEIFPTTAENLIGATEAALEKPAGIEEGLVAQFLDITADSARNALRMAVQLSLLRELRANVFVPNHPFAQYLLVSSGSSRAVILRLLLEQYEPYRIFKHRLAITGLAPESASQCRAILALTCHREEIMHTFISLGTYAHSLSSTGGGQYRIMEGPTPEHFQILDQVVQSRELAEVSVRRRLGAEAAGEISVQEVLDPLITSYQQAGQAAANARSPIVFAGNAVESYLVQLGNSHAVNLQNAHGINAKATELERQGFILTKHLNMLRYLGHVRNATDHGTDPDPDVGHTWTVTPHTAVEYVHVSMSVIRVLVAHSHNRFEV